MRACRHTLAVAFKGMQMDEDCLGMGLLDSKQNLLLRHFIKRINNMPGEATTDLTGT